MADADPSLKGLGKRTSRGLSWNLIGNLGANGLRIAVIPILSRLVSPDEFGIVAAALTVFAVAAFLKDAGVGTALVQRQTLTSGHIETAFSFSVWFGVALAGLVLLAAPAIANFYDQPQLVPFVRVLAILIAVRTIGIVSQALARRDMQFRALAIIDLASYFLGSVTSVLLAWWGYGAWALVGGYLVETAVGTLAIFLVRPVRYRLFPERRYLRDLVTYGAGHTVGELASYFAHNGDNIVVGNQLGAAPLGFYTRAYDLMRYPSVAFSNVAGSVLFSAFSRIQDDPDRLGRVYRRAIFGTSVFLFPTSIALLVLAPELVGIILGGTWAYAVLPFQILAISMLPRTTFKIGATIARAAGDVIVVAWVNVLYSVMVIGGAFLVVRRWGIEGVAVSTSIALFVNFVLLSHLGLRRTSLSWNGFLRAHGGPLFAGALVLVTVWPTAFVLRHLDVAPLLVVMVSSAIGLAGASVAMVLGVRRRQEDWCWIYEGMTSRLRRKRGT